MAMTGANHPIPNDIVRRRSVSQTNFLQLKNVQTLQSLQIYHEG